jgi:DNA-binding CsgD family transcriptional regulator
MKKVENWTETYEQLAQVGRKRNLKPAELEIHALAAYLTGRDEESHQILEKVHQTYLDQNQIERAARCAFWLGLIHLNTGQRARGSGWMARGERLLNDLPPGVYAESGLFLVPKALGALYGGQAEKAQQLFEEASAIGERFSDPDLITLARLGLGQSMIMQGKVFQGSRLFDEMMVTIETEDVSPIATGIVYCAVIETCRKVWDLARARDWTSALTSWCEARPDIIPFRGQCLVRRAEIIQLHGEWEKAREEIRDACILLTRPPGEPAAGEAYYRQAELLRLLGDFTGAEASYREASKWGRNPQPGLALLRLTQEQHDLAEIALRNALQEAKDPLRQAELLPALVDVTLARKKTKEADEVCEQLIAIIDQFEIPYLEAVSAHCRGSVLLVEGKGRSALEHLQLAMKKWDSLQLPYEAALTRAMKGLAYRALNDHDHADMELAAAHWVLEQLGARPDLERINQWSKQKKKKQTHGLTLRELQVLQLLATGKTNKSIAGELFISERTVDRHVSNIFNKLGASSRAEATALALKNQILDSTS